VARHRCDRHRCLPLLIYAATPANVAWLLPGFGLIYGATYAVITIYHGDSSPAAVGAKWVPRWVEVRNVSAPEWSTETS
jgi:hypothetical protein